jgi:hypothetical protein
MTAQETKLFNAFETTLTATAGASDLNFTVNNLTLPGPDVTAPLYVVINPDSSTNREVIHITSLNAGTKTLTCDNADKRYLAGSAATSGLSHASGSVVRMSPLQQHIEDLNDRIDTVINEAGTAVNTTLFLDEDNMASNSATKGVTQQSVKAYVDTQLTAEDLDTAGNSGTGSVDLDSQSLTVSGDGTILTSTASGQGITFAIADATTSAKGAASFSSDNFAVSSGAVTIKDSGVANAELANSSITVSDGSNTSAIALGGTLTFAGTSNEVEVAESSGTVTLSLPATINANTSGNAAGLSSTLAVASGGTGATSLTDKAVLISQDSGTDAVGGVALTTNGQLIVGGAGGPAAATISGGTNVTVTNGANSISIAATDTNTEYTAGDGLDLTSTTFSTDLKSNGGIVIESTELAVDLGASSITGTLDETDGGTGLTSYTTGDILYASGSNTLAKLGIGSSGQTLQVSSGGIVEWATATTGDITGVTAGTGLSGGGTSGTVTLNVDSLAVAQGGTGATSFADKAVIITQDTGTDTLAAVAMDANGELLIGGTSGPAVGTLTAGTGVTITNADGAITIAASDVGDITGVTAGTNLSGGGSSGAVTVNLAIDSEVAFADQVASAVILKDYSETEQAVSSAATLAINLANGNTGSVTLAHSVTDIDFTNVPTDIGTFTLVVTQDGTGSRTMAINAITVNADSHQTAKTAGGAGLTLSTAAAAIDILTFMFVDETPFLFSQLAFA